MLNCQPERYPQRLPLGMNSKQSIVSGFSTQMNFPLWSTYSLYDSVQKPKSRTIFGWSSLLRWLTSFSKCRLWTPVLDGANFFTATMSPFGRTPCLKTSVKIYGVLDIIKLQISSCITTLYTTPKPPLPSNCSSEKLFVILLKSSSRRLRGCEFPYRNMFSRLLSCLMDSPSSILFYVSIT